MVSTFTPNIQLEEPARGDDVGTWDVPVNNNMTLIDKVVGAIATVGLNNSNVILSSPQYESKTIIFNSTLTGSVTITFPTSFIKSYEIYNQCSGSSAFTVTLQTTVAGSQVICAPPGETVDAINLSGNMVYKNLGRVGSYWDYAGSSVPSWVSGCSIPPFVNCDGTVISSATYPALTTILNGTTLPDARGRTRAALNQGTGRFTTGAGGLDGNTNLSGGGADAITLATSQIPAHIHGVTDPGHSHSVAEGSNLGNQAQPAACNTPGLGVNAPTNSAVTNITINSAGGGGGHSNVSPTLIAGITMIRAA
jgi:microcystin-dependent protein